MTPQERELLEGLFTRIRNAPNNQRDAEADAFISQQMQQSPQAAYLLTQTVIVQEEALKAAAAKLDELNARIVDLEDAARAAQAQAQPASFLGGIGKSIFGGGETESRPVARGSVPSAGAPRDYSGSGSTRAQPVGIGMPNVPPPASRWTQQGQPIGAAEQPQQGGGSFLKGALGAAAGVAGGMLLANTLSGLFKDSGNTLGIADAKAGQKPQSEPATAAQERQPWGADSREDTSSAEDDGFEEDDGWDAEDDADGWSEDV